MKFLHTMVRVKNLDESLKFYCDYLGLELMSRNDYPAGKFTLVFLCAPGDSCHASENKSPLIELTYNWPDDSSSSEDYSMGRNFGHIAFSVDDIYTICEKLQSSGVTINRPPRDGRMAFVKSPDGISVELLQAGEPLDLKEPWRSMGNVGTW